MINECEQEGVEYNQKNDILNELSSKCSVNIDRKIKCYRLVIKDGLENIDVAVKRLKGLL